MPATKSSSSSSDPNSLKKEEDPIAAGTEKKEESSLKKEGKPVVVVDWHNCLEKDDVVPEENLHALKKVLEVADVRIISWVGTEARRKSALPHQAPPPRRDREKGQRVPMCLVQMRGGGKGGLGMPLQG